MSDSKVETCTFALPGFGTSRGAVIALAFLEESCPLSRCENAFQANTELLSTITEVWKAARPHLGLQLWQKGRLQCPCQKKSDMGRFAYYKAKPF